MQLDHIAEQSNLYYDQEKSKARKEYVKKRNLGNGEATAGTARNENVNQEVGSSSATLQQPPRGDTVNEPLPPKNSSQESRT